MPSSNPKRLTVTLVSLVSLCLSSFAVSVTALRPPNAPPPIINGTVVSWQSSPSHQSTCDPSTFSRATGPKPANWRDCVAMFSAWATQEGILHIKDVSGSNPVPVLRYGDCVLAFKPEQAGRGVFSIGDRDIDIIMDVSLKNLSDGTELTAQGIVKCDTAHHGRSALRWQMSSPRA